MVEAILQCSKRPGARILACAPSNEAADLIVTGLAKWGMLAQDMLRIMSFSRDERKWPDAVKPYTKVGTMTSHWLPHKHRPGPHARVCMYDLVGVSA